MADAQGVLQAARARGLLPPEATLPADDSRPWPVVLLTAIGAWLAAVPMLGVISLLLGDFAIRGNGAYLIGLPMLAAATIVLRSRDLPVFVEQLAVPALLVGTTAIGVALTRDLSMRPAAGWMCAVSLGLAILIPRAWLRLLLGASAAFLAVAMLWPDEITPLDQGVRAWFSLHLVLFAGLVALVVQANPRHWATTLEPIAVGCLAATLAGLAWWSGMTFLAAGVVAPGSSGELAHGLFGHGAGDAFTRSASAVLAAAAVALLARKWPTLRHPLALAAGLVLAALASFLPALGGALLVLAVAAVTQRWRLAMLAGVTTAWIIGSFYYQLALPLATKALVLVVAGAVLAALAWLAQGRGERAASAPTERRPALWIALAAVATLVVVNGAIWQKERLIAQGQKVYVALAPVDPRSLMQGDYMRLDHRLPAGAEAVPTFGARRPYVVAKLDPRGVAQLLRVVQAGDALAPGEMRIELTPKAGRWMLVSDAWLFREGDATRWQDARFAEFRVDDGGRALLVGMADAQLRPIPIAP